MLLFGISPWLHVTDHKQDQQLAMPEGDICSHICTLQDAFNSRDEHSLVLNITGITKLTADIKLQTVPQTQLTMYDSRVMLVEGVA